MSRSGGRATPAVRAIVRVARALMAVCGWSPRAARSASRARPGRSTAAGTTRMFAESVKRETPGVGLEIHGPGVHDDVAKTTTGDRLPDNSLPLDSPKIISKWRKPDLRTGEREPRSELATAQLINAIALINYPTCHARAGVPSEGEFRILESAAEHVLRTSRGVQRNTSGPTCPVQNRSCRMAPRTRGPTR